jgi:hypothetical protein
MIEKFHINQVGAKININLNTKNIFQAGSLGPNYDLINMPKSCRSGNSSQKVKKLFQAPELLKRFQNKKGSDQGYDVDNSCEICR